MDTSWRRGRGDLFTRMPMYSARKVARDESCCGGIGVGDGSALNRRWVLRESGRGTLMDPGAAVLVEPSFGSLGKLVALGSVSCRHTFSCGALSTGKFIFLGCHDQENSRGSGTILGGFQDRSLTVLLQGKVGEVKWGTTDSCRSAGSMLLLTSGGES
mmetsp:Transcript_128145/g.304225  ORF Transcript_128145/g.304225 Transcript_128145/m.304225 type:complete len:158 (-) Transcript_128145:725-1198(-)